MVQEDHPLADASQQIEPQVTFTGACQNSGAGLSKVLVHALNLSQKHIGKTGPRKTDTCFVAALKCKKGSSFDPALMQIKDAAATGRQHQSARSPVKEGVGLSPIGQRVKPGALSWISECPSRDVPARLSALAITEPNVRKGRLSWRPLSVRMSAVGTFRNCGRRQRMSDHRKEAEIVGADFALSARPASMPSRTVNSLNRSLDGLEYYRQDHP
jgi:hypothetical protein